MVKHSATVWETVFAFGMLIVNIINKRTQGVQSLIGLIRPKQLKGLQARVSAHAVRTVCWLISPAAVSEPSLGYEHINRPYVSSQWAETKWLPAGEDAGRLLRLLRR